MANFVVRRIVASLLLVFLVLSLTFFFIRLAPGDPAALFDDDRIPMSYREELRHIYGLDRPLGRQYVSWLVAVLVDFDWGVSFRQQRPVTELLAERLPNTLLLASTALAVQLLAGLWWGVRAARAPGSASDHVVRLVSLVLYSIPTFWLGLMALLAFSYSWRLLPPGHMSSVGAGELSAPGRLLDLLHHLLLPALVLGLGSAGAVARFLRAGLLDVLEQDFIRTARAKGLSEGRVLWAHALRNAAAPLVQLFGLSLPLLLSGALVVEVVFSWPGVGRLTYEAILTRDYPVILATTALTAILVVAGNLIADVAQALIDPRVRHAS